MASRLEELEKKRNEIWDKFAPLTERMKAALPKDSAEYKKLDEEARKLRGEYDGASTAYTTEKNKEAPKEKPKTATTPAKKEPTSAAPGKAKFKPDDFVGIRHGLHKKKVELQRQFKNANENRRKDLRTELDEVDRAFDANLAREKKYYKEHPDRTPKDWNKKTNAPYHPGQDKGPSAKDVEKWKAADLTDLPAETVKFPKSPGEKAKFQKIADKLPGGRAKDRFITHELKKTAKKLRDINAQIDKLDPRKEAEQRKIRELEKKREPASDYNTFLEGKKGDEPSEKRGDFAYNTQYKKFTDSFSPEQKEAFKDGKEITLDRPQELLLKDFSRELNKRQTELNDEQAFLAADPDHTHAMWRTLPSEEKKDLMQDIQEDKAKQSIAEGTQEFYRQNKGDTAPPFEDLPLEERRKHKDEFMREERRKLKESGGTAPITPGSVGSSVWDTLFGSGAGGEEFISKYPPELRKPMSRAAKSGFSGLQQLLNTLREQQQGSNLPQIVGYGQPLQYQPTPAEFPLQQGQQQPMQQPQQQQPMQALQQGLQQGQQPSVQDLIALLGQNQNSQQQGGL